MDKSKCILDRAIIGYHFNPNIFGKSVTIKIGVGTTLSKITNVVLEENNATCHPLGGSIEGTVRMRTVTEAPSKSGSTHSTMRITINTQNLFDGSVKIFDDTNKFTQIPAIIYDYPEWLYDINVFGEPFIITKEDGNEGNVPTIFLYGGVGEGATLRFVRPSESEPYYKILELTPNDLPLYRIKHISCEDTSI